MARLRWQRLLTGHLPSSLSEEDVQLIDLQLWAVSAGVSCWMIDLAPYEVSRVAGVVGSLIIDPGRSVLEAIISDGTAGVVARWQIGRSAPQLALAPGRKVVIEGMVAPGEPHPVMLDPFFDVCVGDIHR